MLLGRSLGRRRPRQQQPATAAAASALCPWHRQHAPRGSAGPRPCCSCLPPLSRSAPSPLLPSLRAYHGVLAPAPLTEGERRRRVRTWGALGPQASSIHRWAAGPPRPSVLLGSSLSARPPARPWLQPSAAFSAPKTSEDVAAKAAAAAAANGGDAAGDAAPAAPSPPSSSSAPSSSASSASAASSMWSPDNPDYQQMMDSLPLPEAAPPRPPPMPYMGERSFGRDFYSRRFRILLNHMVESGPPPEFTTVEAAATADTAAGKESPSLTSFQWKVAMVNFMNNVLMRPEETLGESYMPLLYSFDDVPGSVYGALHNAMGAWQAKIRTHNFTVDSARPPMPPLPEEFTPARDMLLPFIRRYIESMFAAAPAGAAGGLSPEQQEAAPATSVGLVDPSVVRQLVRVCDMRLPHEWYPYARIMKRKVIYHGGPTNSGKTYHALQRLKAADPLHGGGVYLGPLRLLALEIYDRLNEEGVYCSLLTGQEKRIVPFAEHTSATVEMANLMNSYDVAVIDEIQMIGDSERGHAWTRALLGLRAREIHLCGGPEAVDVVTRLCQATGDELEYRNYERMTELQINDEPLQDYANVRKGDCVVAFSKADIVAIKAEIEAKTGFKCCMVYGSLPSETRAMQAKIFNDPTSGYDVLVASDAIGMGLNLNIRRIIFHSLLKSSDEGGAEVLHSGMIKQIAGRAGRRGSVYQQGEVTCYNPEDMIHLRAGLVTPTERLVRAGLFPTAEQLEDFSELLQSQLDAEQQRALLAPSVARAAEAEAQAQAEQQKQKEQQQQEEDEVGAAGKDKLQRKRRAVVMMEGIASQVRSGAEVQIESYEEDEDDEEEGQGAGGAGGRGGADGEGESKGKELGLMETMESFFSMAEVSVTYFMCRSKSMAAIANYTAHIKPLTMAERFVFASVPINCRDRLAMQMLYQFAAARAAQRPMPLSIRLPRVVPNTLLGMNELCTKNSILDAYLWLCNKYPTTFVQREAAQEMRALCIKLLEEGITMGMTVEHDHRERDFGLRRSYHNRLERLRARRGLVPSPGVPHSAIAAHLESIRAREEALAAQREAEEAEELARQQQLEQQQQGQEMLELSGPETEEEAAEAARATVRASPVAAIHTEEDSGYDDDDQEEEEARRREREEDERERLALLQQEPPRARARAPGEGDGESDVEAKAGSN